MPRLHFSVSLSSFHFLFLSLSRILACLSLARMLHRLGSALASAEVALDLRSLSHHDSSPISLVCEGKLGATSDKTVRGRMLCLHTHTNTRS